ncbi:MAG: ATP-binding protein [Phycisphaerales bacterium]|nr:ATP-binding protein [Phycisphaerales bacterium]MCI0631703.1 ATP-binding protein [Phycisphaerales bacterium]MCI0675357.1 ATP-binding protein [Phycisphaerales bacterium]
MTSAHSSSESFSGCFELHNRPEDIQRAERSVLSAIEQLEYDRASVFAIRLALEEALNNAFKHGNKGDPAKQVRLHCRVDPKAVVIEIEDEGDGFDPHSVPDPTEQENVEIPSGRGLTLMRAFMTEVVISPPGNRVHMKYVRPG